MQDTQLQPGALGNTCINTQPYQEWLAQRIFGRGTKKMAKRARVYGKQRINDLSAGLRDLNIASPAKANPRDRHAFAEVSRNPRSRRQDEADSESGKDASDKENATPVTHSTQLSGSTVKDLVAENVLVYSAVPLDVEKFGKPLIGKRHLACGVIKKHRAVRALTSLDSVKNEVESTVAWFKTQAENLHIEKVAEGSYASILRMQLKTDPDEYSIWKMMPIKPKNAEGPMYIDQTIIEDAIAEVRTSSRMSEVPGFVEVRTKGVRVLQGIIPPVLQRVFAAWEEANRLEASSYEYSEEQYWLLIEMSDAGTDLEVLLKNGFPDGSRLNKRTAGARLTPYQTWDIFWGVAEALAAGEEHAKFEHRDLHLNNICIKRKASTSADDSNATQLPFNITRYTDLEVTLIDYTLSRAVIEEDEVLANSMQEPGLFNQESKAKNKREAENDQHQYETYDRMRELVEGSSRDRPKHLDTATLWKRYVPETNLLWLHHLLFILLRDTWKCRTVRMDYIQDKLVRTLVTIRDDLDPKKVDDWVYRSAKDLVNEERAAEVERGERSLERELEGIAT